ncbi:hypothetical protein AB0M80_34620 [Amycolatopsis sp. NPDC051045]|uniref:helix-turn-helix domain-containing protein n=1 Tax=Amycolatopsis sp. NPDC051045 TaxID=3156922 RepID=UPI00342518C8
MARLEVPAVDHGAVALLHGDGEVVAPDTPPHVNRDERNRRMVRDHSTGQTVTEIARKYGLSVSWTGPLLRQHGADMPTTGRGIRCELDVGEVVRQYESGQTVRELAALHGVAYGKIFGLLLDAGVTMRPRGFSVG